VVAVDGYLLVHAANVTDRYCLSHEQPIGFLAPVFVTHVATAEAR